VLPDPLQVEALEFNVFVQYLAGFMPVCRFVLQHYASAVDAMTGIGIRNHLMHRFNSLASVKSKFLERMFELARKLVFRPSHDDDMEIATLVLDIFSMWRTPPPAASSAGRMRVCVCTDVCCSFACVRTVRHVTIADRRVVEQRSMSRQSLSLVRMRTLYTRTVSCVHVCAV
jgi:hypothetical protein